MLKLLPRILLLNPVVRQFVKYGLVGALNTLIFFVIYTIFVELGVWYVIASGIAYFVGAVNGYLINRNWTFRSRSAHTSTAVRYFAVQGVALAANAGLLFLFVDVAGIGKIPGEAIAIAIVVVATYFVNRWWTFARGDREHAELAVEAAHAGIR